MYSPSCLKKKKILLFRITIHFLPSPAKVIRFGQLLALLPQGTDPLAVIRCLQQVAVLVQGCWVVKSEILYPKDQCSPHSGVSSEHLCRGRDYVVWRFTQSRHVTRKEIASIVKLPAEDIKSILEQISRIRVNCGWEFLFTYDTEFTNRYFTKFIVFSLEILHSVSFHSRKYTIYCFASAFP